MPNITLPDGKKLNFKNKINGLEIAERLVNLYKASTNNECER